MNAAITQIVENKEYKVSLDYTDENVIFDAAPEITVLGTLEEANGYVAVFDADIRRTFAEKFPQPEYPTESLMPGEEGDVL